MRTIGKLVPLVLFGVVSTIQACGSTKAQDAQTGEFPVKGVIQGTVVYNGPPPCSQDGHIVGNAIVFVFDRRNPPPPAGIATLPTNFTVVSGDVLFGNWPRTQGGARACPDPNQTITSSASFVVSPMDPGSYVVQSFYDYTGDFLPTFKFRQLPEATDVGGGYIDLNDAQSLTTLTASGPDGGTVTVLAPKQSDPNYQPSFLPVNVGIPGPVPPGSLRGVPTFTIPPEGYVADNVTVTIGARLPLTRPYFYPQGVKLPVKSPDPSLPVDYGPVETNGSSADQVAATSTESNPAYVPVLSFPNSWQVYAQPNPQLGITQPAVIAEFQARFPQLRLNFGVPAPEKAVAVDRTKPEDVFHMQLDPDPVQHGNGGIFVWWDGNHGNPLLDYIPEGPPVPKLWPLVALVKLKDDPSHTTDPQSLTVQGADLKEPAVVIQGITLSEDSLLFTAQQKRCVDADPVNGYACTQASAPAGQHQALVTPIKTAPDPSNLQDHVTVMVRPSALCFDPRRVDLGGLLVTPHFTGTYPPGDKLDTQNPAPVVDRSSLLSNPQIKPLVSNIAEACLPPGRYGINVVYPTGQAWTTPNEIGHCAALEGDTVTNADGTPGTCTIKPRPVLTSQGTRAIVEVTNDPDYCVGDHAVPPQCTTLQ